MPDVKDPLEILEHVTLTDSDTLEVDDFGLFLACRYMGGYTPQTDAGKTLLKEIATFVGPLPGRLRIFGTLIVAVENEAKM